MPGVLLSLLLLPATSQAGELSLLAGSLEEDNGDARTHAWAIEYRHPFGEHVSASFAWLNEGHVPGHHRDGQSVQLWASTGRIKGHFSLAAGLGPYRYFDTVESAQGADYRNHHGWGTVASLAARYYTAGPWSVELRANRIVAGGSFDTNALMLGVGYRLPAPARDHPLNSSSANNGDRQQLTAYVGRSIVNSFGSEHAHAWGLEYRRSLAEHIDVTVGWLDEGDAGLIDRRGVNAQLWWTTDARRRLRLGVGLGPYLADDKSEDQAGRTRDERKLSWLVTASAALRLGADWEAQLSWSRVHTNYHRDSDVILLGAGYRW